MELNALDFPEPKDAIGAARDGDAVYFPGGLMEYQAPFGGFQITKGIELFGDGPSNPGDNLSGTTLVPAGGGGTDDVIVVAPTPGSPPERVRLRDFKVARRGSGGYYDGHQGIRSQPSAGTTIRVLRLDRINVQRMNGEGIVVVGGTNSAVDAFLMSECLAAGCNSTGITIQSVGRAVITQSGAAKTGVDGWLIDSTSVAMYQPSIDASETADPNDPSHYTRIAHMTLASCPIAIVDAAHFENFGLSGPEACLVTGDVARGGSVWLGACRVIGYPLQGVVLAGVRVDGSVEGSVFIGPNHLVRTDELVDLQVAAGCTVLPQMFLTQNVATAGDVVLEPGARVSASSINRVVEQQPLGPFYSGLTVPSKSDGDPTWAVQNGMLYYDSSINQRLRVRIANAWKTVVLD